jgi:hypothetical protein
LSTFDEASPNEPLREIKLDNKRRGELAELAFMRKAASFGLAVAKPWGDSDRYDVVVRIGKTFWRVQVKSVWAKAPRRPHYRIRTVNCGEAPYTPDEIDFFVAYIFAEDTWYIFPVEVLENRKGLCVTPGSKKSKNEQYHEAWDLMKPASAHPAGLTQGVTAPGAPM